jgi:hypothetical protein
LEPIFGQLLFRSPNPLPKTIYLITATIEMKNLLAFILSFLLIHDGFSQEGTKTANQEETYTKTINSRAQKIVSSLGINDSDKSLRVQAIIAQHYRNLNTLHSIRDSQLKLIRSKADGKEAIDVAVKNAEAAAAVDIKEAHQAFISSLSKEITEEQIVKVKDGLTYNVVNITYAGYLDMLPNLTEEQKKQIRTWLEEAREYAMDAESSEKKHGWFGKYKGRINNYLSAAGYDLKKEGEAWQQRMKEREEKKKATNN